MIDGRFLLFDHLGIHFGQVRRHDLFDHRHDVAGLNRLVPDPSDDLAGFEDRDGRFLGHGRRRRHPGLCGSISSPHLACTGRPGLRRCRRRRGSERTRSHAVAVYLRLGQGQPSCLLLRNVHPRRAKDAGSRHVVCNRGRHPPAGTLAPESLGPESRALDRSRRYGRRLIQFGVESRRRRRLLR